MNRYPSAQVAGWHEQERQAPVVERAEIAGLSFDYYVTDFEDAPCDNLVSVLPCDDPSKGVEPLIRVSSQMPELHRGLFALHEYIEFHASQIDDSNLPTECWEIERFVISTIPNPQDVTDYIERRLDMFTFLEHSGSLTSDMRLTVAYLEDHRALLAKADLMRQEAARLRAEARDVMTEALDIEAELKGGAHVPEAVQIAQDGRNMAIASLLMQLGDPRVDFRDRQSLMDTVMRLNGGEYPDARQQAMLLTMYQGAHHEEDHHDAGPDTDVPDRVIKH